MSRAATKTKAKTLRKTPAKKRQAKAAKRQAPAQILDFPHALARKAGSDGTQGDTLPPLLGIYDQLQRAMDRSAPHPLPKKATLETHFDSSLDQFTAVWSEEIGSLLRRLGAEAAVLGDRMALPRANVSFETLAHETAHLLQVIEGMGQPVPSPKQQSEAEAEARAHEPGTVREALPDNVVALRDTSIDSVDIADPETAAFRQAQNEDQAAGGDDSADAPDTAEKDKQAEPQTQDASQTADQTDVSNGEPAPRIDSQMPELPEEAKEAQAALEASVAALSAAVTPEAYLAAFKGAPPSLKADKSRTLDADLAALASTEADGFADAQPEFAAELKGDAAAPPAPAPIVAPQTSEPKLEDQAPGPAPEPEIAPTQDLGRYDANDDIGIWAPPGAERVEAAQVADSISEVSTKDPGLETSPGPAPKVPLAEETDPKRATEQSDKAKSEAAAKQAEAAAAVANGKGPEQVRMQQVTETTKLEMEASQTQLEQAEPVEGVNEFLDKDFDAETKAVFDAHHGAAMESSLAGTEAEMGNMVQQRDAKRAEEDAKARKDLAEAESQANDDQRKEVGVARQTIQDERQATLDQQAEATQQMRDDADAEGQAARTRIDDRVKKDEAEIDAKYKTASDEAEAKVQEAEKDAEAEKKQAEKDAANKSWWEKAIDWVAEQLSKLGKLIGKIFEAARNAVGKILDGVKALAFKLIDAAAGFIKGAIELYASVLKTLVSHVIGSVFPELAEQLNGFIDSQVERAKALVDKVASGLKAAVSFIVDTYKKALQAILSFVEGALNTVLAVASAALKGDWGEVARLIIEPILKMLGIDKEVFYQFVGKTVDALGKIVNDPLAFLGNLFGAVVGGFRLFGQNILDHLIKGIIGWLTGALGSTLTIPKTWDLMGVLDLARQILGLTLDMVRRIAVRILGEAAVEKIEFFLGYAKELITRGWGALFEQIMGDLQGLFSTVAGQITTFIVEKVVKAGIVWVASLINPAGALAKLVLMIWDLIMWLKDNLMRFVDIIKTVVNGMIDIANGKLEPASKAIEKTLGNLLAPAIDLLARLLGLGNVAGRVKEIIEKVRKKIEDAIVKLIKRVMAKFTGKGKGGAKKKDDKKAKTGALMTPKKFKGAGETHTLFLKDSGKGVKPMMRSVEQEVNDWLDGLRSETNVRPYVVRMNQNASDEELSTLTTKTTAAVVELIPAAKKQVQELDTEGDQAKRAVDTGASSAAKEKTDVAKEAGETANALEAILKALGIERGGNLIEKFKPDLDRLDPKYGEKVKQTTFNKIGKNKVLVAHFQTMNWAAARQKILDDPNLWPAGWKKPLNVSHVLRNETTGFMAVFYAKAESLMSAEPDQYYKKTFAQLLGDDTNKKKFMGDYFLNRYAGSGYDNRLRDHMMSPGPAQQGTWIDAGLQSIMKAALRAFAGKNEKKPEPDQNFKAEMAKKPYGDTGIFTTGTYKTLTLKHYKQLPDGKRAPDAVDKDLAFVDFMVKRHTDLFQENREEMANAVRKASPRNHEWLPASLAVKVMQNTIRMVPDVKRFSEASEGFSDMLHFQHKVRTSTSDIIFSPSWVLSSKKDRAHKAPFLARAHIDFLEANKFATPSPDEWRTFYPHGRFQTLVPVLQGHSGGVNYRVVSANGRDVGKKVIYQRSQRASPSWHGGSKTPDSVFGIANRLFSRDVDGDTVKVFAGEILGFFKRTTLSEDADAAALKDGNKETFSLYKLGAAPENEQNFDSLIDQLVRKNATVAAQLESNLKAVVGDFEERNPSV